MLDTQKEGAEHPLFLCPYCEPFLRDASGEVAAWSCKLYKGVRVYSDGQNDQDS